jgi:ASCH domain
MRALSIKQPWAGLIAAGIKDIENRSWRTRYRGGVLIHASTGRSGRSLSDIAHDYDVAIGDELARLSTLVGGIIGSVEIVDCVTTSESPWFDGALDIRGRPNFGFALRDARVVPFHPMRGRLRFFDAPAPDPDTLLPSTLPMMTSTLGKYSLSH